MYSRRRRFGASAKMTSNYLAMAKYIQLRTIADKILVPDFADIGWDLLEAKLTAEGISVLCHKTKDEMIEV